MPGGSEYCQRLQLLDLQRSKLAARVLNQRAKVNNPLFIDMAPSGTSITIFQWRKKH
jgi:hypothetical protein